MNFRMRDLYASEAAELMKLYPVLRKCVGNKMYLKVFSHTECEYDYIINTRDYVDLEQLMKQIHNLMIRGEGPTSPWMALHILTNILMEL